LSLDIFLVTILLAEVLHW